MMNKPIESGPATLCSRTSGNWRIRLAVSTCLMAIAAIPAAQAADQPANQPANPEEEIHEIIITGTAGGAELDKQQASFSVTTVSAEQIEAVAPKSSAELLTQLPAVWVESSGGVSGANINVLGFPEAGDAPHVTFEINGAPIYPTETLSFMEHSSLFRVDETIATVEGELGGPGSVFGRGEAGLTANFRLKEGGDKTTGIVKYTGSDYQLQRFDAVLSGQLAESLYYMVGGYVASSPGIRDTQFSSEKGQQFTINLTKRFDNGKVDVWSRYTNDHGQWILPMFPNSGNDLGTFAQLGNFSRFRQIQIGIDASGRGIYQTFDFSKGRGWDGTVSGANAEFKLSDAVTFRDNLSFTSGNADTYGLVPDGSAIHVSQLASGTAVTESAAVAAKANNTTPTRLPGTTYVQNYGFWIVQKALRSHANDLSLAIKAGANNDLTVGYYTAQWSSDDLWSLGNITPFVNVANGDLLNTDPTLGPATTCTDLKNAGSNSSCFKYGIRDTGDARASAAYIADSYHVTDAIRIDAGFRRERDTVDFTLDSGPGYPINVIAQTVHSSDSNNAYTGAVDYELTALDGVFARYTRGFAFPNFDAYRGNSAFVQGINLAEVGYKHTEHLWRLYATAFRDTTDALAGIPGAVNFNAAANLKSKAYGLQVDGTINVPAGVGTVSLRGIGTWQHATYTAFSSTPAAVGKKVLRQPDFRLLLNPSFNVPLGTWSGGIYGSIQYIGSRFADPQNTVQYDSYTTVDAGVALTSPWNMTFRAYGENISNRHDPTEGDPRATPPTNFRPVLGRSVQFSVAYTF